MDSMYQKTQKLFSDVQICPDWLINKQRLNFVYLLVSSIQLTNDLIEKNTVIWTWALPENPDCKSM